MDADVARDLADRAFSYREIGATGVQLPDGYRHFGRNEVIGQGRAAFDAAAGCLMTWGMHRGAGLRISTSSPMVATGANVLLSVGPPWLPVEAPCRVVHTVEQPDRIGFTYGTLDGHPISGEESFNVLIDDDGQVRFVLIAFSRPATWLSRIGGPLGRVARDRIVDRYLDAIVAASGAAEAGGTALA